MLRASHVFDFADADAKAGHSKIRITHSSAGQ
jgi:hypothetical protein